jgi:hypothetical protein
MEEYSLRLENKEGKLTMLNDIKTPLIPIEGRSIFPRDSLKKYCKERLSLIEEDFIGREYKVKEIGHYVTYKDNSLIETIIVHAKEKD